MKYSRCSALATLILVGSMSAPAVTYTVSPSGSDDTASVQMYLDLCAGTGPGCTVQLTAGEFYLQQVVAQNFRGTLRGMGKGVTTVYAKPGLQVNPPGAGPDWSSPPTPAGGANPWPDLITFTNSDFKLSDMTIKATESHPLPAGWTDHGGSLMDHLRTAVTATGSEGNSSIERIHIQGGPGSRWGMFNVAWAILIGTWPADPAMPVSGTHSVTASSVFYAQDGILVANLRDADVRIGGASSKGNTFENNTIGVEVDDLNSSSLELSHSTVKTLPAWGWFAIGVGLWQSNADELSRFRVFNNTIDYQGWANGICVTDAAHQADASLVTNDVEISRNQINIMSDWGNAIHGSALYGALIVQNTIKGSAWRGILLRRSNSQESRLLDNNLLDFSGGLAPIHLTTHTSYTMVVGGSYKVDVLDQGTDNIVIGGASRM